MNYETYFPEQRHLLPLATIRRERLLPEGAIGETEMHTGERVDLRDVVARGALPARYVILDAAEFFRLRKPEDLERLLLVGVGSRVQVKQPIAGKSAERGRRLFSPVSGSVVYIGDGRIIVQEEPEPVDLYAGLVGQIMQTHEGRGVVIETTGAVMQGAWGNGRLVIGTLRGAPGDSLETLTSDSLEIGFRGMILYTRRPLTAKALDTINTQKLGGVVAPSMDAALLDRAMNVSGAVMLLVGFGQRQMSPQAAQFLDAVAGKQATLDATPPDRFGTRRPELVVNVPPRAGQRPPIPPEDIALQVGMNVRLTRGQYAGQSAQIVNLPKTPHLLDNGLRLPCAQVQLGGGETTFVPLANLEVFGA